jgi:hypothetical protein
MANHRIAMLASLGSALLTLGQAAAAEPKQVWEATGFKNPESALHDSVRDVIYVSNLNGAPDARDGNGFISKLSSGGEVVALEWVTGLDAPKGLALAGDKLYVTDIDQLVEIDTASGAITRRYPASGAKFLNDATADRQGRVFVSDMLGDAIWMLEDGNLASWLQDDALENPNGLLAQDGRIVVASWGRMEADFSTKVPGHLKLVDVASRKITPLGDGSPLGNLDGVEPDGKGGYTVTDWVSGALYAVTPDGKATRLLDLAQGSADHGFIAQDRVVLVPMMMDGKLVAYRLD